jgi:hypothetical protein
MNYPPEGTEVVVTLADSSAQTLAYWTGSEWWMGVEDDPNDAPLGHPVESWAWRTD